MPDHSELLSAVLADPDDDAPRLAYAAWCGEQTDPALAARARFIEAEIAASHLDADEAFVLRCDAKDLLAAYGDVWTVPVTRHASRPVFDRGFVELVTLSATDFLARAEILLARAPIRHLDLTEVVDVAEELFSSPHLARIRSLRLDRAGLRDEHVAILARSPFLEELRWLSIGENRVTMEGAGALAASDRLPRLAYVRFFGNPVDPGERQAHDQGVVVDAWLPPEGEALEARFGPIRWLHTDAQTLMEVVPDRFRIA